jgi:predicted NAD-dependent protein-ADP-ribosyltransferase YbiA (DUF1768 family)
MRSIIINHFEGEYRFLSTFWPCQIPYHGLIYPTVEHAYQAEKVDSMKIRYEIRDCPTPGKAKKYLTTHNISPSINWTTEKKLSVMNDLLRLKFNGSEPFLVRELMKTGKAKLSHGNTWEDIFWGIYNGKGADHSGRLLMQIRTDLFKEKEIIEQKLATFSGSKKYTAQTMDITRSQLYQKMIAYRIGETEPEISESMLNLYHRAAKLIEIDGTEGFYTASNLVGKDIATALIIAHVRKNMSDLNTYPCNISIEKVNKILAIEGIIKEKIVV